MMLRQFQYCCILATWLACWPGVCSQLGAAERRPNVVIVMTDDQGYGDLAAHGHPLVKTPHLDKLHAESVRLTDFHVMPLCAPTRAMLMTGRNPLRDGVWATVLGRSILPAGTPTVASYFAASGYATGMFGKWHLGDNAPARPQDKGFQTAFYHGGGGVGQTPDHWGNRYFNDTYFANGTHKKTNGYCTDVWFDHAMQFMKTHREKPFLVYLATNAPHSPYIAPPELEKKYRAIEGLDAASAAFYAMIENIDQNVGRLMQFLKTESLEENTIFIFMTDNGTAQGMAAPNPKYRYNAGMRGTKGTLYEGGHRVPCFIRWPGGGLPAGGQGRDEPALACAADLLPTLARLCDVPLRPDAIAIDGLDLSAVLKNPPNAAQPERTLFIQFGQSDTPPKRGAAAVLTRRWRVVNGRELYDIQNDPAQKTNLAATHPAELAQATAEYNRWFDQVEPALAGENPIWVGSGLENPVRLNCMDWHTGGTPANLPWNQPMIRRSPPVNGYWAIDVRQAGDYEIKLMRWPAEANLALNAGPENARTWPVAKARIEIGQVKAESAAGPDAHEVTFQVKLAEGPQRMKTELLDSAGQSLGGAFYAVVRRK